MEEQGNMERKYGIVKTLIFISIPLVVFLLVCEFLAYVYLHSRFENFDLEVQGNTTMIESFYQIWEHPSNYTTWNKKTHLNNLGFRRFEDTSLKKEDGVFRIFVMGGSASFGSGAAPGSIFPKLSGQGAYSSNLTISAHLEKMLNEKYPGRKFEVINAAIIWTQIHQQLLHYYRKVRSLEPDLIISLDGQNDAHEIEEPFLNMWEASVAKSEWLWNNPKRKLRPLFRNSNLAFLLAMVVFRSGEEAVVDEDLVQKYTKIERPETYVAELDKHFSENYEKIKISVNEYIYNLTHFHLALKEDKVPHILLLQPQTIMDLTKKLTEKEKAVQGYMFTRFETHKFPINFFREVEIIGNVLRAERNIPFWSLQNMFEGVSEDVYSDYCHFTPQGNELVAARILELVEMKYPRLMN